ncbi:MAG: acetyl-CoA carboxylase carboxyltransferase subunit alpha [Candidatus Schekmanbacteria bacterium RBG_16_38_10]|uniref:Acetyl-coenzyme A carboxylase carboxyl transferase subunit alpha n=1 Tax=Candidatus Schekmanbacteria bacterium RBG_16_38_10 TaxID=1817879 RepID=A0A1F7RRR2_9BACT|nr:MAG: acetyl-CoA carboxylase carboxyltransferase subunit alpha [Candidatus Schekmanbacteria bacterium RBG_16_38_10]
MSKGKTQDSSSDFQKSIEELEARISELESVSKKTGIDLSEEVEKLRERSRQKKAEVFSKLTPWQMVQIARDPNRPEVLDYIGTVFEDFVELHGDRAYGDDKAIICGLCKVTEQQPTSVEHTSTGTERKSYKLMLIAHRKGKTTKERVACNFGSPHPEGYRKALEKMKFAEKFHLPIVTLVNTPGAYPGIGAEERGQANIIAKNLFEMSKLRTPIISIVIGEGGSGGALAICVADKLSILENAYLSVISPEGCAAILWRDGSKAPLAAEALKLTPQDLLKLGIVDEIIPEPLGGAHRDSIKMANTLKTYLLKYLEEVKSTNIDELLSRRYEKYRKMGVFVESEQGSTMIKQ